MLGVTSVPGSAQCLGLTLRASHMLCKGKPDPLPGVSCVKRSVSG